MRSLPAPPSRMLPSPHTLSCRSHGRPVALPTALRRGREVGDDLVQALDPGDAGGVQGVAAEEAAAAHLRRDEVVAAQDVVEASAGQRLELVVAVADAGGQDVQRGQRQVQVGVHRLVVAALVRASRRWTSRSRSRRRSSRCPGPGRRCRRRPPCRSRRRRPGRSARRCRACWSRPGRTGCRCRPGSGRACCRPPASRRRSRRRARPRRRRRSRSRRPRRRTSR